LRAGQDRAWCRGALFDGEGRMRRRSREIGTNRIVSRQSRIVTVSIPISIPFSDLRTPSSLYYPSPDREGKSRRRRGSSQGEEEECMAVERKMYKFFLWNYRHKQIDLFTSRRRTSLSVGSVYCDANVHRHKKNDDRNKPMQYDRGVRAIHNSQENREITRIRINQLG
jgi:hypothetical protein